MKMTRSLVGIVAGVVFMLASGVAVADGDESVVKSSNTHAMVKVVSSFTNTIISVPWTFYMPDNGTLTNLPVNRLVRPTNLTPGDYVLAHQVSTDGAKTNAAWQLVVTTEPCVSEPRGAEYPEDYCWAWEPVTTVTRSDDGAPSAGEGVEARSDVWRPNSENAIETMVKEARGRGVWLVRQKPVDANGQAIPFYLYGQFTAGPATVTIPAGSKDVPSCTLLANPNCAAETVINNLTWEGVVTGDTLILQTGDKTTQYCTWNGTAWGFDTQIVVTKGKRKYVESGFTTDLRVPAGAGFWYVRRAASEMTVTFPAPTTPAEPESESPAEEGSTGNE